MLYMEQLPVPYIIVFTGLGQDLLPVSACVLVRFSGFLPQSEQASCEFECQRLNHKASQNLLA